MVTGSEQIGAYGSTTGAAYYMTSHVGLLITVTASKVIRLYAKVITSGATTTRFINSDSNGRTGIGYVKVNYQ